MWMVLFKPSSTGVGRVELYTVLDNYAATEQKKICWQKTPERKVVRLSDCLSVTPAPKQSCPPGCTAFRLNTIQCNYTLASTASQDWLSALCLLAFQVSHISPPDESSFHLFLSAAVLSFGKAGEKPHPQSERDSTMRKLIQYLPLLTLHFSNSCACTSYALSCILPLWSHKRAIRGECTLHVMFTMPPCLQKDPGESDRGGFERGNGLTMEDNDLYSSWKTGNAHQSADDSWSVHKSSKIIFSSVNANCHPLSYQVFNLGCLHFGGLISIVFHLSYR